jgi:hypothetical protein
MKKITVNLPNIPKGSRIYIAGPMSIYKEDCYNFAEFFFWEKVLRGSGYLTINPARIDCDRYFEGKGWDDSLYDEALDNCLSEVSENADALFMLEAWMQSPGALREIAEGREHNKAICYEVATELLLSE